MTQLSSLPQNLAQWLHVLETRFPCEINMSLSRVQKLAEQLNLLHWDAVKIIVGGTNGKGSTVTALSALYQAAGYQVGLYMSPHLLVFNERISINQVLISDEDLCRIFVEIEHLRGDLELSFFETTTLAAFLYFKRASLDVIILEVGMGGRLDATNVIDADLSIITTIALDHQAYLGDTLEAIGKEKAGIMRADKPCIYADLNLPASILEHANQLKLPLYRLGVDYWYESGPEEWVFYIDQCLPLILPQPRLNAHAVAAALMAVHVLRDQLKLNHHHYIQAFEKMYLPARQELIAGPVCTVLDVAHNVQAALKLSQFIQEHFDNKMIYAVFSALQDKDICGLIAAMAPCIDRWYPALLTGKRASSAENLSASFAKVLGFSKCPVFDSPLDAYQSALKQAKKDDVIVVFGSFYTVEPILKFLQAH